MPPACPHTLICTLGHELAFKSHYQSPCFNIYLSFGRIPPVIWCFLLLRFLATSQFLQKKLWQEDDWRKYLSRSVPIKSFEVNQFFLTAWGEFLSRSILTHKWKQLTNMFLFTSLPKGSRAPWQLSHSIFQIASFRMSYHVVGYENYQAKDQDHNFGIHSLQILESFVNIVALYIPTYFCKPSSLKRKSRSLFKTNETTIASLRSKYTSLRTVGYTENLF